MQFSVRTLFLTVSCLAVTCYCLLYANPVVGDIYYTVTIAAVILGLIMVTQLRGDRQAYWMGFTIVAASYVWLSMSRDWIDTRLSVLVTGGSNVVTASHSELATTTLLA